MGSNRKLLKELRTGRARFFPTDFHVHSPASADVRLSPRFDDLSEESKKLLKSIPENLAGNPIKYESKVLKTFTPATFFQMLIEHRSHYFEDNIITNGDDWAILAITDHNVCTYACDLASYAWSVINKHRLIVLPGIELTVNYLVTGIREPAAAHILCIFAPKTTSSDIRLTINLASNNESWDFGKPLSVKELPKFISALRLHQNFPCICIAAHVGSSSGVQNETKDAILSRREAAITRVKGELQTGDEPDTVELQNRLRQLEKERDATDEISLEILSLIGLCGFDALQVRGKHDEVHYRRLHRFRGEYGRAVPIVCSDAHRVEDIFITDSGIPHLKLSGLSSGIAPNTLLSNVRHALRLGETRFNYTSPGNPPVYWIRGLKITPETSTSVSFWPFETTSADQQEFILPLSRNLNCLIGGRGSGKSAALEALAFISQPSDFDEIHQYRDKLPDYYSRAKATLDGCNLTACWQFMGNEKTTDLPKRAVFASRYFNPEDLHESIVFTNADDIELLSEQVPNHSIQYYRLGEIEKQAGPEKLRKLFDQICGEQIQQHEKEIQSLINILKSQRKKMVKVSQKAAMLTEDNTPLREYVQRKRLFDAVNVKEVQDAYEEVDLTSAAQTVTDRANSDWRTLMEEIDLNTTLNSISEFFTGVAESVFDPNGEIKPYHESLAVLSYAEPMKENTEPTHSQKISIASNAFDGELKSVSKALEVGKEQIDARGKEARDALATKGFPTGGKDREAKKSAFDDAKKALKKYRQVIGEWEQLDDDRKNLVELLASECQLRSNLRQKTAVRITNQLKRDLDPSVLIVEADAQPQYDKHMFVEWMKNHFTCGGFKYRNVRIDALVDEGLTPASLRELLMQESTQDHSLLQVPRDSAKEGNINENIAKLLFNHCVARSKLDSETEELSCKTAFWEKLPQEIRDGLITFPSEDEIPNDLKINDVLELDEIVFDDVPVIRLNDRPNDSMSKPRPVESLSPGQRCSAILPIILLTGQSPLIIDQPEDNMDNRLIRQVIVNILSGIKLRRQVILATHNPNLPVLGDVEQAVILQGVGEQECQIRAKGDLDASDVVHHLTDVMEGGREAFQYRQTIYQAHWPGPVNSASEG